MADVRRRAGGPVRSGGRAGETGGVTRRIARLEEFDQETQALARQLAGEELSRLLTLGEGTVEIAHEQLATQWSRYQEWINNLGEDRRGDDTRLLHGLIPEAAAWQQSRGRERRDRLARGYDLEAYRALEERRPNWLAPVERGFLVESEEAAWWAAVRRRGAVAALISLTLAAGAGALIAQAAQGRAEERALAARVQLLAMQARRAGAGTSAYEIERAGALALESIEAAREGSRPLEADALEAAKEALIRLPVTVYEQGATVVALSVLPDGRLASGDVDGRIKLWPVEGWGEPVVLEHGDNVGALAVLPDGRLASGGGDGRIKLWPAKGGGEPLVLNQGSAVHALAVLPDGRLASGDVDGRIVFWPSNDQGEPVTRNTHVPVMTLAGLPDGRLASGDVDGRIRLWARDVRGEPAVLDHGDAEVGSLAVLSDGEAGQRRL